MSGPRQLRFPSTPAGPTGTGRGTPGVDLPDGVVPIGCDEPGSFAWSVFNERHRALVDRLSATHATDQVGMEALHTLLEESTTGVVAPLRPGAHDREAWAGWGRDHHGRPWSTAPFLWAESYFYRRLLDAVGFYTPGPSFWLDPFEPLKAAELPSLRSPDDRAGLGDLLLASTWGNRADLGFRITDDPGAPDGPGSGPLLVDHRDTVLAALERSGGRVAVVADNAGIELAADLALIDRLLTSGSASRVDLHVKPAPYYVSDAVAADVRAVLRHLATRPNTAGLTDRLRAAETAGRFRLRTHWFHTSPLTYHHLPVDLARLLASYQVVVFKGDLNYRRLVGDLTWPATTSFADTVAHLPANVVALRTVKSDVIVGLDPAARDRLDRSDRGWRTSGSHAVIQSNLQPS